MKTKISTAKIKISINKNDTIKDLILRGETTYRDVFNGYGDPKNNICDEGMRYLVKRGPNQPLKKMWETCSRPMWLLWAFNIMSNFKHRDDVSSLAYKLNIMHYEDYAESRVSRKDSDHVRKHFIIEWI